MASGRVNQGLKINNLSFPFSGLPETVLSTTSKKFTDGLIWYQFHTKWNYLLNCNSFFIDQFLRIRKKDA